MDKENMILKHFLSLYKGVKVKYKILKDICDSELRPKDPEIVAIGYPDELLENNLLDFYKISKIEKRGILIPRYIIWVW